MKLHNVTKTNHTIIPVIIIISQIRPTTDFRENIRQPQPPAQHRLQGEYTGTSTRIQGEHEEPPANRTSGPTTTTGPTTSSGPTTTPASPSVHRKPRIIYMIHEGTMKKPEKCNQAQPERDTTDNETDYNLRPRFPQPTRRPTTKCTAPLHLPQPTAQAD